MHYHCEIILPPTEDIDGRLNKILAPFDENSDEARHAFWDWWVVGGRWSGQHQMSQFSPQRIQDFYKILADKKITVSKVICGKQELSPSDQQSVVDDLWKKHFPEFEGDHCPLFKHSGTIAGDICDLTSLTEHLKASRVILADEDGDAFFMLSDSVWNGVAWEDTTWDGSIVGALELFKHKSRRYTPEYLKNHTPQDDWNLVTIDYHT